MRTRIIHAIAGFFIMTSILLSIYVHQNWLWFTAFVGVNLFQSSLTNWCLMNDILVKLGIKDERETVHNCER
ncbi:MAG: YgaP family membrane protein [Flammeovirgaceae bacterium]